MTESAADTLIAPQEAAPERTADHLIDHLIDHPEDLDEFFWDVKLLPDDDLRRLLAGLDASVVRDLKARLDDGVAISIDDLGCVVEDKFVFSRATAARSIRAKMDLAMVAGEKDLWWFDGDIYRSTGIYKISDILYSVGNDNVNRNFIGEVLDRLRVKLQLDPVVFNPSPYLMPLDNGIIDLKTGEFRKYRAEDLLTFKYNAKWSRGDWRHFIWFLCTSLPDPRDVLVAIDIMTAVAVRIPFEIMILLLGGGSNGKGILERIFLALFTIQRSTAIPIGEVKESRFGGGALVDVDLWVVSEVEEIAKAINTLKKITTGEHLDIDIKFGDRKKFKPHLMTIIDSNHAIDYGDNSYGRQRRVRQLNFCYTFGDEPGMRPIDRDLEEKLTRPEVLDGLVQIIAARAPSLIKSRKIFSYMTTTDAEEEHKRQSDSIRYFCEECLGRPTPTDDGKVPEVLKTDVAYDNYLDYCTMFKVPTPESKIKFGRQISEIFSIRSMSTCGVVDGKRQDYRYYPGIYLLRSPEEVYSEIRQDHNTYDSSTTDIRQNEKYNITISNYITTDTTDSVLKKVLEEICRMYAFISSCESERDITYERYLEKPVVSVVSVVEGSSITVSARKTCRKPVVNLSLPVDDPTKPEKAEEALPL